MVVPQYSYNSDVVEGAFEHCIYLLPSSLEPAVKILKFCFNNTFKLPEKFDLLGLLFNICQAWPDNI